MPALALEPARKHIDLSADYGAGAKQAVVIAVPFPKNTVATIFGVSWPISLP